MTRPALLPLALLFTVQACTSSDDTGPDTDTDATADTDEGPGPDTDLPPDTDPVEDTDLPEDTDPPVTRYEQTFETPALTADGYDATTPPGFTFVTEDNSGTVGTFRPSTYSLTSVEPLAAPAGGNQCVVLGGGDANGAASDAKHVITTSTSSATLVGGETYTLTAAIAGRLDVASSVAWIALVDDSGDVLASETEDLQSGHTNGSWSTIQLVWEAPAEVDGESVFVQVGLAHAQGAGIGSIVFDNVTLVED